VMVRIDGRITGQVVDAAGRPVAGALLVTAPRIDGEPVAGRSGPFPESGPDGHFELDSLPETSLHVFAAKDRLFGEAIALPGSAVTIRLQAPRDIDERVRATYLASLDLNGYRNLIPYWSFLGPDSMKDLALRVDGAISPDGRHNPARAGQAFGLWLQALATKDPVLAGRTGPGLLALYDPECRLEDARQAVAAACARYGDARGWHFASDWINGQMPRTTVFDPSEDRAALLFRLAGTAMILKRADVDSLFRLAVTTANREDKAEVADFAWNWGASLAVSGEPALLRLNGCVSPQAEFRAWAAAVPILAQTDLPAAGRALDRVNDLRTNPAVAAWIAGRGAGQRGWSDSTVDEAENALLHAQTQAGDPELLSAASLAEYAGFHLDYGALAMSALAHHDDATARAALSEAKDGNLAYFASLAATFDAALSQDLFARAADQQIASETTSHSSEFDPSYTYYHGFVDPAMSRVLLESQWIDLHKPDAGNGNTNEVLFRRGQTAAALYALDESRCLELTREAASESHSENSPVPGLAILMESDRSRWALKPP